MSPPQLAKKHLEKQHCSMLRLPHLYSSNSPTRRCVLKQSSLWCHEGKWHWSCSSKRRRRRPSIFTNPGIPEKTGRGQAAEEVDQSHRFRVKVAPRQVGDDEIIDDLLLSSPAPRGKPAIGLAPTRSDYSCMFLPRRARRPTVRMTLNSRQDILSSRCLFRGNLHQ